MGLILVVVVRAASIQARDGAKLVFDKICNLFPKLHLKDYEYLSQTSETMIYAAMTHLMLSRLARKNSFSSA